MKLAILAVAALLTGTLAAQKAEAQTISGARVTAAGISTGFADGSTHNQLVFTVSGAKAGAWVLIDGIMGNDQFGGGGTPYAGYVASDGTFAFDMGKFRLATSSNGSSYFFYPRNDCRMSVNFGGVVRTVTLAGCAVLNKPFNVRVSNITHSSFDVLWNTNLATRGTVVHSEGTGGYYTNYYTHSNILTTSHRVRVSYLAPRKTYYYMVSNADPLHRGTSYGGLQGNSSEPIFRATTASAPIVSSSFVGAGSAVCDLSDKWVSFTFTTSAPMYVQLDEAAMYAGGSWYDIGATAISGTYTYGFGTMFNNGVCPTSVRVRNKQNTSQVLTMSVIVQQ